MVRLMIRVKDKNKIDALEKYGSVVFKSPILNLITLDAKKDLIDQIKSDENVISCDFESQGNLMPV
ncbi:hypothetical protein M3612_16455 [Niallia taxi]|uniref:hypothetical protein n=1 Tax=Niallia taxi TaxID=2499688 RepID=UPI00203D4347|nr:hypothetical protein [Niallia taxi]MCM3216091.1 hypothetical protein [Niallia taxi]